MPESARWARSRCTVDDMFRAARKVKAVATPAVAAFRMNALRLSTGITGTAGSQGRVIAAGAKREATAAARRNVLK